MGPSRKKHDNRRQATEGEDEAPCGDLRLGGGETGAARGSRKEIVGSEKSGVSDREIRKRDVLRGYVSPPATPMVKSEQRTCAAYERLSINCFLSPNLIKQRNA